MKTILRSLSKPLALHTTKVCSTKIVCGGVPLPNTREFFYEGQSACMACKAKQSKDKWAEKKRDWDLYS